MSSLKVFRFLAVIMLLALAASSSAAEVEADSSCGSASGSPAPPIGEPEPAIGGQIMDGTSVVVGATITLYRCDGQTPVSVATDVTDSGGNYLFEDLDGPNWYYVEATIDGPLLGKSPASGTANPTAIIGVGEGNWSVDLEFE